MSLISIGTLRADVAFVGDVKSWNVGTGQVNGQFQVTQSSNFGGLLELGLRAQTRGVGPITPVGDVYSTVIGNSGTVAKPRAIWNFDYSAYYADGISTLDSLTLAITTPVPGSSPGAGSPFDLINRSGDCHLSGACAQPQDPTHYRQDSQNPVFAPWFQSFDINQPGTYHFVLTATKGANTASTQMDVVVTPEPTSIVLLMTVMGGIAFAFRRRLNA